jgi:hypothetical protein
VQVVVSATTATATEALVVVPSPSCPESFLPQQAMPAFFTTQVVSPPDDATRDDPGVTPATETGDVRVVVVPSPS